MKLKYIMVGLFYSGLANACLSQKKTDTNATVLLEDTVWVQEKFKKYFDSCSVDGSIAIYDNNHRKWILSDTLGVKKETLPASTFKIINLLIALQTKTIVNEKEVIKWVGSTDTMKYGYRPEIYHDMTVEKAFEISAGWVFIELAKRIGRKNYKEYLTRCNYGNLNLSQLDDDFWNFGEFAVSPINQVEFIKNLYQEKLPFSKRNIEIVKRVMITEQNTNYTIRAKTGWTRENNTNTGWWVGYVERENGIYFFATRLLQDRTYKRDDFGSCRKEITKKIFQNLKIIE
ncbi:MAG: penicillin-binding transpeptidase domain-containing protein [Microscillaceae bacterium]|nr:penicillin-binding transpeptidase domain-containing protein [Microscillaceae bacterium]